MPLLKRSLRLLLPFQITAGHLVSSDPGLGAGQHSPWGESLFS